jgi:hypothetical protein
MVELLELEQYESIVDLIADITAAFLYKREQELREGVSKDVIDLIRKQQRREAAEYADRCLTARLLGTKQFTIVA